MEIRDIIFDDKLHRYTDQFSNVYTSVTTCIHKFEPAIDKDYWVKVKAIERGVTPETIINEWENKTTTAINNGKAKHDQLETNINNITKKLNVKKGDIYKMITIYDILNDHNLGIVSLEELENSELKTIYPTIFNRIKELAKNGYRFYAEICVYSAYHLISGAIDLLAIKFENNVPVSAIILDWKTNKEEIKFTAGYYKKDINANYTGVWIPLYKNNKLLFPLNKLEKCKGSIYGLQLNTYAALVEMAGVPVVHMEIFHIRTKEQIKFVELRDIESELEVVNIDIPNMRDEVNLMLAHHFTFNVKNIATYQQKLSL